MLHGYSSKVRLSLVVDGRVIPLAQVGPGYVILRTPEEIPPCNAEISIEVDGADRRIPVRLSFGAQPFDTMAQTVQCLHSEEGRDLSPLESDR